MGKKSRLEKNRGRGGELRIGSEGEKEKGEKRRKERSKMGWDRGGCSTRGRRRGKGGREKTGEDREKE